MKSLTDRKIFLSAFAFISVLIFLKIVFNFSKPNFEKSHQSLTHYGSVADFSLTDHKGRTVDLEGLKGKVWVANFIFTRCAGVCPLMSNKMRYLQDRFKEDQNVRLVSFSVDPEFDFPEVLDRYGERFGADAQKWFFLTGDKTKIYELSQQHFLLGVSEIPEAEREALDQTVRHSSKFVLVDAAGKIRGYYDSEQIGNLDQMVHDAKILLKETRS